MASVKRAAVMEAPAAAGAPLMDVIAWTVEMTGERLV